MMSGFSSNSIPSPALVVINQGDASLSIVDPERNIEAAVMVEGVPATVGHEVATSRNGRLAYVPLYSNSGLGVPGTDGRFILVIDLSTLKILDRIDLARGLRPHCILYEKNSNLLYVTTELENTVSVIDPDRMTVIAKIPTGHEQSHMMAITHDGLRGYTSNVSSGTISVLDLRKRKFLKSIRVSNKIQRISISNDDKFVFTADQTKPQLAVVSTSTHKVVHRIELPSLGYGSASTLDGRSLIVTLPTENQVAVVDLHTLTVRCTILVGVRPQEVLIRPDRQVAYVSCFGATYVTTIDTSSWRVIAKIAVGRKPDGMAWASAPK